MGKKEEKLAALLAKKKAKQQKNVELSDKVERAMTPQTVIQKRKWNMPTGEIKETLTHKDTEFVKLSEVKKLIASNNEQLFERINQKLENEDLRISIRQEWYSLPFKKFTMEKANELSEEGWKYAFVSTDPDDNYKNKNVMFVRNKD